MEEIIPKQEIASDPLPSGDFQQVPENMKSSAYEMLNSADFEEEKEVELDSDSSNADSGRYNSFSRSNFDPEQQKKVGKKNNDRKKVNLNQII